MNSQFEVSNKETTLLSLAMLKIKIDEGKDYFDYLEPFVIKSLKDLELEIVNDINISKKIKEIFWFSYSISNLSSNFKTSC